MKSTKVKVSLGTIAIFIIAAAAFYSLKSAYMQGVVDSCSSACQDSFIVLNGTCTCISEEYTHFKVQKRD